MKIVAIRDMSAGNAEVGEMWQETKIFEADIPVRDIVAWAAGGSKNKLRKRLTITVSDEGV